MKTALAFIIAGTVLLTVGLAFSPLSWLALCVPGVALIVAGLLKDVE
jgi:hypothetical protein